MNTFTLIPILLRMATSLFRCLSGSATPTDWVTVVDSLVEIARKAPAVARYIDLLTPWIEKIKALLPQILGDPAQQQQLGLTGQDMTAAKALVQIHESVMQELIDEGLLAQGAIATDDDVLDNT